MNVFDLLPQEAMNSDARQIQQWICAATGIVQIFWLGGHVLWIDAAVAQG